MVRGDVRYAQEGEEVKLKTNGTNLNVSSRRSYLTAPGRLFSFIATRKMLMNCKLDSRSAASVLLAAAMALFAQPTIAADQLLRIRAMVQVGNEVVARPFMVIKSGNRASVSVGAIKGAVNPRDLSLVLSPTVARNGMVTTLAALVITPIDAEGKPNLAAKREETGTLMIAIGQRGTYDWKDPKNPKSGETIRLQLSIDPATAAQVEAMKGSPQ
jgi:hypothetical protein